MKILGIDFETTWANPVNVNVMKITEIGAVLVEWETKKPLEMLSLLINDPDIPPSPPELVELTGLTDEIRLEYGVENKTAFAQLCKLMEKADFCVAHNGNSFDKPLLNCELDRLGMKMPLTPWLDSKTDVPYPKNVKSTKLSYLAADHGFANPFAHRALFDVLTMVKVLGHYDLNEVIALSKEETKTVVASVSFQEKHLARDRGYYWNPDDKIWCKDMKESKVAAEQEAAPFTTNVRRKVNG